MERAATAETAFRCKQALHGHETVFLRLHWPCTSLGGLSEPLQLSAATAERPAAAKLPHTPVVRTSRAEDGLEPHCDLQRCGSSHGPGLHSAWEKLVVTKKFILGAISHISFKCPSREFRVLLPRTEVANHGQDEIITTAAEAAVQRLHSRAPGYRIISQVGDSVALVRSSEEDVYYRNDPMSKVD
ncbi:Zinc finger CCCH-type protein [Macrophomina phaseolina MS6]|uniref:Zinc finger CCCH-type protein n=1 Tax=Macrophomina phaseolina (strain MS6) TaxID=1126212 RepID=K2SBJ4_MACPH|nr:Zinc finger CCCH-type protein [Macrophomina phaseolina MS6]